MRLGLEHLYGTMERMIRTVRVLPLLFLPVLLTACGTEKADHTPGRAAGGASSAPGPSAPASGPAASATPDQAEVDARVRALGVAPELVYVTDVSGYTPARQSVGVNGDDGFSVSYTAEDGAVLTLFVDRVPPAPADCPGDEECVVPEKGRVVRLRGEKVPRSVLRAAARAVHRPSAAELAALLPDPRPDFTDGVPVQRGDLPPGGGAPDNSVPEGAS